MKVFISHAGSAEVSEWLFVKILKTNEVILSNNAHNIILRCAQEFVANESSRDSYNLEAKDLHYLSFVARQFAEKGIADKKRDVLLESIWTFIESEDFYWSSALEPQYLEDMRSVAKCISMAFDDEMIGKQSI